MNIENQQLILFTARMLYHLQNHEQKNCPNSLKLAHEYKAKADAILHRLNKEAGAKETGEA